MQYNYELLDFEELASTFNHFKNLTIGNQQKVLEYVIMVHDAQIKYLDENPMITKDRLDDDYNGLSKAKIPSPVVKTKEVIEKPYRVRIFVHNVAIRCPKCDASMFFPQDSETAICSACLTSLNLTQI